MTSSQSSCSSLIDLVFLEDVEYVSLGELSMVPLDTLLSHRLAAYRCCCRLFLRIDDLIAVEYSGFIRVVPR